MLGGEGGERRVVLDQAAAPGLEAAVARRGLGRAALDGGELRAQRRRVGAAHQLADELQLAALRLVALDALRLEQRGAQLLAELESVDLRLGQLGERHAERLQLEHFALAGRLADNFIRHAIIIAPPCRSATGSAAIRPSCARSPTPRWRAPGTP